VVEVSKWSGIKIEMFTTKKTNRTMGLTAEISRRAEVFD
jgi:hypothetical protein